MSNSTLTAIVAAIVFAVLAVGFFVGRAGADHGATADLGSRAVPEGAVCVVRTANNISVHGGNVLLIGNGDEEIQVPAIEDVPDTVTETELVARSDELTFVVLLGETEGTSLTVSVVCEQAPPPPPSSTEPPSSTTTSPPTTLPPSTPEPPTVTTPTFTG